MVLPGALFLFALLGPTILNSTVGRLASGADWSAFAGDFALVLVISGTSVFGGALGALHARAVAGKHVKPESF